MPKANRLTNSSDETDIASLLSGDAVFSVPYFQRAYKWKPARLTQLEDDILGIVDTDEAHFLGAVILHGRHRNPSDPGVFEVIDGQQRITTLYLYIAAAVRTLADLGETSEAVNLFLKYLVINRDTNLISNLKLHSGKEDRAQLNHVLKHVLANKSLKEKTSSFKSKFLPNSGKDNGPLRKNYKAALRFFKSEYEQGDLERLSSVYGKLLQSMSVVQIDVSDPTNGPKIFDSLNSRQEPMTIGDLVRNEIFSRVASEHPSDIEQLDQDYWQPFYLKFQQDTKNLFDSYFFPYGLIQNPNLMKSEVYTWLRDQWKSITDPQVIIVDLSHYQDAFIDIASGSNLMGHSKAVAKLLVNLWLSKAPSSIYPFLMPLSKAIQEKTIPEEPAIEVLEAVESFLVRRAVYGLEPTGLHAVFKRLWSDCKGKPTQQLVKQEISKHKTVAWPNDEEFKKAILARPLYQSGITQYFLLEYDKSLGGDQPKDIPWIEHVLPESPAKQWFKLFSKEQHLKYKDVLANLIPLSQQMNISLSNKPYADKRDKYKRDSMFKSARDFADKYNDWTPEKLEKRALDMATWAVNRWAV
jgi:uncharacterized protein with ParB-like and HNH nuclease domain